MIFVIVEGGIVQEVLSDKKEQVVIVDYDTDGVDTADLVNVNGENAYVYSGLTETSIKPDLVEKIKEAVKDKVNFPD